MGVGQSSVDVQETLPTQCLPTPSDIEVIDTIGVQQRRKGQKESP
jgi:hypothetical protein